MKNGEAARWSWWRSLALGRFAVLVLAGAAVTVIVPAASLAGKSVKYRGIHPLPPHTGEFCAIDFPHVHAQAPSDMRGYRVLAGGEHLFVGDEAALGYTGPKHAYFGPHPIAVSAQPSTEPVFCYLRGAHFHATPPVASAPMVVKEGVAWFTGPFPPEFERDRFNVWVNDIRPIRGYVPPRIPLPAVPPGYRLPAAVEVSAPVPSPPAAEPRAGKANGTASPPPSRATRGKAGRPPTTSVPGGGGAP